MAEKESEESGTLHAGGKEYDLETSGPYRGDLEQGIKKEALGDGAATEPLKQGSLGEKEETDTAGTNPKNKENAKPD